MHALELVKKRSAELTRMGLKSSAAVIQRVYPLISEAREAGFSHRTIYGALSEAGLRTTWNNYRIALGRATKAAHEEPTSERSLTAHKAEHAPRSEQLRPATEIARNGATSPIDMNFNKSSSAGTSTATHVMDALRQAREVASKDYGRIARELYRQSQRNRPPKEPS